MRGHHSNDLFPARLRTLCTKRLLAIGEPNFDYQDPLTSSRKLFSTNSATFWHSFTQELDRLGFSTFTIARTRREYLPVQCIPDAAEKSWQTLLNGMSSLEQFLTTRSANLRGDVNRRVRRLQDLGKLEYQLIDHSDGEGALQELNLMRAAYEELWEGQPAGKLFETPGLWIGTED